MQSEAIAVGPPLILCIDDEAVGLRVRKILLERVGYRVLTASDGAAGVDLFQQHPVQAVVLDLSMPEMTGGEVARRLRTLNPNIPILMLSGYTSIAPEIVQNITFSMNKGEGAPVLLEKIKLLLPPR